MSISLNEVEMEAIQALYDKIKDEFKVKKIMLFGSKARGSDEKYSDVDLLILSEKTKIFSDRSKLSDISADVNIDYGVALSCLYFNYNDWQTSENVNPFLKLNIEKEGIELTLNKSS